MSGYYFKLGNNCFLPHPFQSAFYETSRVSLCCVVVNYLTLNRQTGQRCPITCTYFLTDLKEKTVPQWTFKLHSAPVAAENCHLKGFTLKVNNALSDSNYVPSNEYRRASNELKSMWKEKVMT
jgi:hypothetical protein